MTKMRDQLLLRDTIARGRLRFGWLDDSKRASAVKVIGLQEQAKLAEKGVCGETLRGSDCTVADRRK